MIFIGTDRIIRDILEEHGDTLPFLWERRNTGLRARDMAPRSFADLEERIAVHTDALVLADIDAIPMLMEGLGGEEVSMSLASGYALLGMEDEDAVRLVLEAFNKASGLCLEGLARAASYRPVERITAGFQEMAISGPVLPASAAAEVFAFHGIGDLAVRRIGEFLSCCDASVRQRAWRIIALIDGISNPPWRGIPMGAEAFDKGLRDEDQAVRQQALETAAWTRQPWLLDYCRGMAGEQSPERMPFIRLLAVLGESSDLDLILAACRTSSLGPARFEVLTSLGHPAAIEILLEAISKEDTAEAVMAGSAYMKLTGMDIESEERVKLPPADGYQPDQFDTEFLEEASLPDPDKAKAHWEKGKDDYIRGVRWRNGIDMSRVAPPHFPDSLDNQARWESFLRARFQGFWQGGMADRERFPLPGGEVP